MLMKSMDRRPFDGCVRDSQLAWREKSACPPLPDPEPSTAQITTIGFAKRRDTIPARRERMSNCSFRVGHPNSSGGEGIDVTPPTFTSSV